MIMSYEPFDTMLEKRPTPEEFITELFERTDENGMLYLPAKHTFMGVLAPEPAYDYCCPMTWNLAKYEVVLKKFNYVFEAIKKIGTHQDSTWWTKQTAKEHLGHGELYEIWNTYIRPFDTPGFDLGKIKDVDERIETIALAEEVAERFSKGEKLSEYDREFLQEGLNTDIPDEENKYWNQYHALREEQSEQRIGKNVYAYDTIVFAQRLCRLINLGALDIIIGNEAIKFAEMFVLHEYATETKFVSSAIRERKEKLEEISEDELDEMYRNRPQANSAKSLLPLFVYQILGEHSSPEKHLRQQDIIDLLKQSPYEIKVERKAISRILYTLNDWFPDSVLCDKNGWWKE